MQPRESGMKFSRSFSIGIDEIERLKREYIDNAILLAESFAKDAVRYMRQRNEYQMAIARTHAEVFYRQAVTTIDMLKNKENKTIFAPRLVRLRQELAITRCSCQMW